MAEKKSFTTKLYEVCADDELRPVMMCVHFKGGFAYASDGHIAIKQSLDYHLIHGQECLEDKSIHKDNYKAIMGFEKATCDDSGVSCEDKDGRTAFYEYFDRKGVEIPNFEAVLKPTGQKSVEFIGIKPEFLARLTKALHTPTGSVRLQFQGIDKAILVDVVEIVDQEAIIMPAILNDSLFGK
jgi:hypothetical protein